MKKFLKILLIIIGIVFLIFAALICIGLFVDYDDHIENGRYTKHCMCGNLRHIYLDYHSFGFSSTSENGCIYITNRSTTYTGNKLF